MAQVTYIGTPDDHQTQMVTEAGITFVKGQPVKVNDRHMFGGVSWMDNFRNNPTFSVGDDKAEAPEPNEDDEEAIKAELDKRGIQYRSNASVASLRALLAKEVD